LSFAAVFHQFRREVRAAQERAEAAIILAQEQGFPSWTAQGSILRGWTLAQEGQAQAGIEQIHQGLTAWRATGAEIGRTYFLALLDEAYGTMGQPEAGLTAIAEALTLADTTEEGFYEPELYRLKGELLLRQGTINPRMHKASLHTEAETCFHQALEVARRQHAKSLELRAAMSLSRLWQTQGKPAEARQMLAEIYAWFTEGFDTPDLQEAKTLLEVWA
jgi:predicted ATPase